MAEFKKLNEDNAGENGEGEAENGKKKKGKKEIVKITELYRFAERKDIALMIIGTVAAIVNGLTIPATSWIFGDLVDVMAQSAKFLDYVDEIPEFMDYINITKKDAKRNADCFLDHCDLLDQYYGGNRTCDDFELHERFTDKLKDYCLLIVGVGVACYISGAIQAAAWNVTSERQSQRIREAYLANVLRQDIAWFDAHETGNINSRLADDITQIKAGMGDKVGIYTQNMVCAVASLALAFVGTWKLTLVLLSFIPLMALSGYILNTVSITMTAKEQNIYATAGIIAEQALGSIRTVCAFGGEAKEYDRYSSKLGVAEIYGRKKGFACGASMGFNLFVNFIVFAVALLYGGKLIRDGKGVDDVVQSFLSVLCTVVGLAGSAPALEFITTARGAAKDVMDTIDLQPTIDGSSEDGMKPKQVVGNIKFKDVYFNYPARPDVKILQGLSLEARPGQTVALVGASGCGKSTTVQLLLRFYDPERGQVLIDDNDIKDLNIQWLRQNIGLVSQEPVLFATTIEENIRYGKDNVTKEEIIQASKNANAYDFIMDLPLGFDTLVGERGAQLSGGQKQRIAIARALVRDPRILLLDEATSALDTESEAIVQDALDKAREGRTTLVIAHRLSTIKNADIIIGIEGGKVVERGTHDQLMSIAGIYNKLVTAQTRKETEAEEDGLDRNEGPILKKAKEDEDEKTRRRKSLHGSQEEIAQKEAPPDIPLMAILRENKAEWLTMTIGIIGAMIHGCAFPSMAYFLGKSFNAFSEEDDDMKDDLKKYSLIIGGIGLVGGLGAFVQGAFFSVSGSALTKRLRERCFDVMIRMEMSWFDMDEQKLGSLTTMLSTDAAQVQGASGARLGQMVFALATVSEAFTIGFVYGWQLTLMSLVLIPLVVLGSFVVVKGMGRITVMTMEALTNASKIAVEVLGNMRTVVSLNKEKYFLASYVSKLNVFEPEIFKKIYIVAIGGGLSNSSAYMGCALLFYFGAEMIEHDHMDTEDVLVVIEVIILSAFNVGTVLGMAADYGRAKSSAARIFQLMSKTSQIDPFNSEGICPTEGSFRSTVRFENAKFFYSSRPDVMILQGLNLRVEPGQTVALVGGSGCGKSTTISLLERFYNLVDGNVYIDKHSTTSLNIRWLRSQMGLVSQEPVLFDLSIAENIAYGDNSRTVPMDEIVRAARAANIHNFIDALPEGYETRVGDKGTQLSGGQKQRVAIARALVRNPKILLLDEATSALDTESERVVQEALDKARAGRTCITIAHRLSTIRDADKIVVIKEGQVVEEGTHDQLIALQGEYYKLEKLQQRAT